MDTGIDINLPSIGTVACEPRHTVSMGIASLLAAVMALLAVSAGFWLSQREPEAQRQLTPLDYDSLSAYADRNSESALRWGTYRSGHYLGIRSRTKPVFVSAGLLWGSQHEDLSQLRHECRQDDRLQKYGWLQHDGRRFARQVIEDQANRVQLTTHYLRLQEQDASVQGWATRVAVQHMEPQDERLRRKTVASTKLSLFFYVELVCDDEKLEHPCRDQLRNAFSVAVEPSTLACDSAQGFECTQLVLKTADSSPFQFTMQTQLKTKSEIKLSELRFSGLKTTSGLNIKEKLVSLGQRVDRDREVVLDNIVEDGSTLVVIQAIVDAPVDAWGPDSVVLDVLLNEASRHEEEQVDEDDALLVPVDAMVDEKIAMFASGFQHQFEQTFRLSEKQLSTVGADGDLTSEPFNESHIAFAQAAFSNLIGGIGYFYGSALVQQDPNVDQVRETEVKPLFTAVPSRSFFPRGFLWDEGFHQIGISAFDSDITRDVVSHWMGVMEQDGYIAREQIRGEQARKRVWPSEFLVQHGEHANPPSLLLCIEKLLARSALSQAAELENRQFMKMIFPFLERWYEWFLITQRGPQPASFRWRGRKAHDGKLISNTLSSGLDDYPRASNPSDNEMHLDLLCWLIKASDVMSQAASFIGLDESKVRGFKAKKQQLLAGLTKHHWNKTVQAFFDVGEHSEDGLIEHQVVIRCQTEEGKFIDTTAPIERLQAGDRDVCPPSHPQFLYPLGDGQGNVKVQAAFVPGTVCA